MSRSVKVVKWLARLGPAGLLLGGLCSLAEGAEPATRGPVHLFGVYKACVLDAAAMNAIALRLQQMGEMVLPMSQSAQSAACAGVDCVRHARAHDASVQKGRLLGGRLRMQPSGETLSRLWLSDISTGETVYSDDSCMHCEVSELLARQAANLIDKTSTGTASKDALGLVKAGSSSASDGSAAVPPVSAVKRIALSVKGGNAVSNLVLSSAANKVLLQMGYEVKPAGSASISRGDEVPTLDISIAKDKATGNSSIVLRHLTPSGGQTILNVDCGAATCRGSQLERIARMNIGTLLDAAAPTSRTYAITDLVAAERAQAQLQDPTECQIKLAQNDPPGLDSGSKTDGDPPTTSGIGAATNPTTVTPRPQLQPSETTPKRPNWTPYRKTWRIVGGLAAGAVTAFGIGLTAFAVYKNGEVIPGACSYGNLTNIDCVVDTTRNRNLSIGLTVIGLSSLGFVLAAPTNW